MRDLDLGTITDAAAESWRDTPNARFRHVLERLVIHLHDFARDVSLTHEDWRAALDFLTECGRITDDSRNEFALLSDVLGLTSLVDLANAAPDATAGSVLGPFYAENSPVVPLGADIAGDNPGETVLLTGMVRDGDGTPIPGALVDLWQADTRGNYAVQDPSLPAENLRCRQYTDDAGRYAVVTVLPAPYSIPMDGPVGALLAATRRSPWRPAHIHVIASAEGHAPLVTELFIADDPYLDSDAVFGVRAGLVFSPRRFAEKEASPVPLTRQPRWRLDADITLARRGA